MEQSQGCTCPQWHMQDQELSTQSAHSAAQHRLGPNRELSAHKAPTAQQSTRLQLALRARALAVGSLLGRHMGEEYLGGISGGISGSTGLYR